MPLLGGEQSEIACEIGRHLGNHAALRRLGRAYLAAGFVLAREPETVVVPDVAFVRAERLPAASARRGLLPLPPDLAVEVVAEADRPAAVAALVAKYLAAGVRLVWVAAPRERTVTVHAGGRVPLTYCVGGALDGGEVLPELRLPVADIFR